MRQKRSNNKLIWTKDRFIDLWCTGYNRGVAQKSLVYSVGKQSMFIFMKGRVWGNAHFASGFPVFRQDPTYTHSTGETSSYLEGDPSE